ncbi:hypothetical protein BJ138DRAFT_1149752 [Hygrophoropsis aurantiaca]|uniref:Uncharacterized protein n=1 Tax=Hygrophoropsis aurantiaca TaxID=72124 RepID=A0ACB8AF32_9AGAM|nr:hypothetical protein BJ138DRAFT_1149752 [Hygrophoropsis aurantiaca]
MSTQAAAGASKTRSLQRQELLPRPVPETPNNMDGVHKRRCEPASTSSTPRADVLLPSFSTQFSHLPTPQSPSTMGSYLDMASYASHSPVPLRSQTNSMSSLLPEISLASGLSSPPGFRIRQILTPDLSPLLMRSRGHESFSSREQSSSFPPIPDSGSFASLKPESPPFSGLSMLPRLPESMSPPEDPIHSAPSSPLAGGTSPFNQENSLAAEVSTTSRTSSPVHDHKISLDPTLSTQHIFALHDKVQEPGGEITRIHAQLLENQQAIAQEAEARRPDYLKRAKRVPEAQSTPECIPNQAHGSITTGIGVMESPIKGRRLTLFQETSDESFEESLMAGGYGRYRSDWLHQVPLASTSQSTKTDMPEDNLTLNERELKKKNRLAAFFDSKYGSSSNTTLCPVEVEGMGRVLMNVVPEPSPSTRSTPAKRKRPRKKKALPFDVPDEPESSVHDNEGAFYSPNWPDAQFPWRLRAEQRTNESRAEQTERRRCIENFFDMDSDEEEEFELLLSPNQEPRIAAGLGKMYPLLTHVRKSDSFRLAPVILPSDPADARTALLSKRSIRTLSYRSSRQAGLDEDSDAEVLCICNGRDDGRELVQCDDCHTWYHLQCIGVKSTADLGREEDPWFCTNCAGGSTHPLAERVSLSEPILVPTDEKLKLSEAYDPPFFHAGLIASPATPWTGSSRPPKTPPRSATSVPYFSSGSSWDEPSSKHGPDTPQYPPQRVRVYTTSSPNNAFDRYGLDDSPFDPTSTPSRGINFGAPFMTPKNNVWPIRGQELFHTPAQPAASGFGRSASNTLPQLSKMNGDGNSTSYTPLSSSLLSNNNSAGRHFHQLHGRLPESPLAAKRPRRAPDATSISDLQEESRHARHRSQASTG